VEHPLAQIQVRHHFVDLHGIEIGVDIMRISPAKWDFDSEALTEWLALILEELHKLPILPGGCRNVH
jgi:hypothetical protein